jgi:soluble lytic murein transglycosylase-like protein
MNKAAARAAAPEIRDAIHAAAKRSGVSFDFLMKQAEAESGFDPKAKAATSSATGLYQFIERTWFEMVRLHGPKYGLDAMSDAIRVEPRGERGAAAYRVDDPALRQKILDLRNDPRIAAAMAAEFTRGNQDQLRSALGREPSATDLYMAHFLGAKGAIQFLRARGENGMQTAADLLPEAAAANRPVFLASDGRKRSLDEVYQRFAKRFQDVVPASSIEAIAPAIASAPGARAQDVAATTTRALVLQAISRQGIPPATVAMLASLDDHDGRTLAGRTVKRRIVP